MEHDRPLVTRPPKRPEPIPQRSGPSESTNACGSDAAPMRWAADQKCGHRIPALIGSFPAATMIDPQDDPSVLQIITVDAEPGECPVCDNPQGIAVRDS